MNYSEFEGHIKNELFNLRPEVDTALLVDSIRQGTRNRKRRRWFLIISLFSILLLLLVGSSRIFSWSGNKQIEENSYASSLPDKKNHLQESPLMSDAGITPANKNESFLAPTGKSESDQVVPPIEVEFFNPGEKFINPEKLNLVGTEVGKENEGLVESESVSEMKDSESIIKLSLPKLIIDLYKPEISINKSPGDCYDFRKPSKTFDLGIDAGISYPFKQLEQKAISELFESRKGNERSLEALHLKLHGKFSKEDLPIYFSLGGAYTRISEQLKLNYSYTKLDTTQGIISITQSQNGDTLTIIKGDIITETTIEKNIKQHYYFHLIDIPLGIGYEIDNRKFLLGFEAGIEFNLMNKVNGKIQTAPKTVETVDDLGLFENRLGITYYGAVNYIKPIFGNGALYLSARFRYIPKDFSTQSNIVGQRYKLAGLHLGYLYSF